MQLIRLHILGLPHTITRDEFSHCAFTGKVQRFSPMMRSVAGYEVYHYGIESSWSGADKQIDILSLHEFDKLRLQSYVLKNPGMTLEEAQTLLLNKAMFIGNLGDIGTPLYIEFNKRLRTILKQHYRSTSTDIVCLPFGKGHEAAVVGQNFVCVETGIGYPDSFCNYRIFESFAYLHQNMQKYEKYEPPHYWFVAPNYYNTLEFSLHNNSRNNFARKQVGFLGRISETKGCHIIKEISVYFPEVDFILCGQGDATPFLTANVFYKEPIHGAERGEYLGSLMCLLAPSNYCEPFCGVNVEAQLCGTPVIGPDCGAFTETVENFKTGLRCHTLQDYCYGIRMALQNEFDRDYIANRARTLYDMFQVAKTYDYIFRTILDVHNGQNGWYSPTTHIDKIR
jgi:glycosyltransferase involved in cell wall biosynthesis